MIIGTRICDCADFVRYVRDQTAMQDQIKEWSDEDLEAFYMNVFEYYDDDDTVDEMEIWDRLRFKFCVYKHGTDDNFLDIKDFVLDFYMQIHEITGLELEGILDKIKDKNELDELVFTLDQQYCFMFTSANGDVIVANY